MGLKKEEKAKMFYICGLCGKKFYKAQMEEENRIYTIRCKHEGENIKVFECPKCGGNSKVE